MKSKKEEKHQCASPWSNGHWVRYWANVVRGKEEQKAMSNRASDFERGQEKSERITDRQFVPVVCPNPPTHSLRSIKSDLC